MTIKLQRRLAGVLAGLAGAVIVVATTLLIAHAARTQFEIQPNDQRVTQMRVTVGQSAAAAPALQAEYDRQRDLSLQRDAAYRARAWLLIAASTVFLAAAKWRTALRHPQPVPPRKIVALFQASQPAASAAAVAVAKPASPAAGEILAPHEVDTTPVDTIVARIGRAVDAVIPILHGIQHHYGYLPDAVLRRVCELTEISPAQIAGVATFYPRFRRTPIGKHVITVCHGTACHVAGAPRLTNDLRRRLHIPAGLDTDAARDYTVQEVPCLGCCTLAPVVQVDGQTRGHVTPDGMQGLLVSASDAVTQRRRDADDGQPRATNSAVPTAEIRIGLGSCCVANGSALVHDALLAALAEARASVAIKSVGCVGMCHQTPFIELIKPPGPPKFFAHVSPESVPAIVRQHFRPRGVFVRLRRGLQRVRARSAAPQQAPAAVELRDPPIASFLGRQVRIATEHCGALDPLNIDEYLSHDGFKALRACAATLTPAGLIDQVRQSGLRGRGGAGYLTTQKWATANAAPGDIKYVICNGDEGDPGAFMDRMLMESYPYRVLEGLAIAAFAVGATEAFFYIRAEYPLAIERIGTALRRCEERGLLSIDRALKIHVVQGAGAFVCGEETALIATLEGQRGTPRLRPPFPAERGLWGRPTLVNNVETLAVVPWIVRHGPAAFARLGTATSKGTKVFSLTGKVRRGGLIEVPMGITIREIVEEIGGGVRDDVTAAGCHPRQFKAVQIGGPSGGCVPASLADTPVDYEALAGLGAIMGSGGLVVLDDTDCMVDIARYFLAFSQAQACGKCAPGRVGTLRMLEILERICQGEGVPTDLDTLEQLGRAVAATSLCGLCRTAPNPVLTTLRYFRDEYEAHLAGRCPAGKCKSLVRYVVTESCTGCTLCAQHCPAGAIALRPYERHEIDDALCTRCDVCRVRCPEEGAIRVL